MRSNARLDFLRSRASMPKVALFFLEWIGNDVIEEGHLKVQNFSKGAN